MSFLHKVLSKFKKNDEKNAEEEGSSTHAKNWYSERFESILIQRNMLFLVLLLCMLLIIISVFTVYYISNSKSFEPYIIQVEEETGATKVVNVMNDKQLEANDALARYFIKKYLTARETYNPVDFNSLSKEVVRLFSNNNIYRDYIGYIRNKTLNPEIIYADNNTTYLIVKSWSKLGNKYIVRFSINETRGGMKSFDKIAVVEYKYVNMNLTDPEMDTNPVGFLITGYRVDDDKS